MFEEVSGVTKGGEGCSNKAALWQGLLRRGVFKQGSGITKGLCASS